MYLDAVRGDVEDDGGHVHRRFHLVSGLGFRVGVEGVGLRVKGVGLRVQGRGLRVAGLGVSLGFRVEGAGLRVQGVGLRVEGVGLRVYRGGGLVSTSVAQCCHSRTGHALLKDPRDQLPSIILTIIIYCCYQSL